MATDLGPAPLDVPVTDTNPLPVDAGGGGTAAELAWDRIPLDTQETLNDIWGPGDGTFYAVGAHGALLWFNGVTWTPLLHLTDADLYGVAGLPGGDVWVVGAAGTVLKQDNAGWNVMQSGVVVDLHGVAVNGPEDVFMVGDAGTILRYDGVAFKEELSGSDYDLRAVFIPPGGVPHAGGTGGQILRRTGGVWVATQAAGTMTTITDIWGTSNKFVVAVGTGGAILVSTSPGQWSAQTSNDVKDNDLFSVWGVSTEEVWCIGSAGTVIHYDGKKWTVVVTDGPLYTISNFRGVYGVTAGEEVLAFAVGEAGAILGYDTQIERNWQDTVSGPDVAVSAITHAADGFYAVGEAGLLLRWLGLRGWSTLGTPVAENLLAVAIYGDGVLAVGEQGAAIAVDDLGRATRVDSGTTRDLRGEASVSDGTVWVVGDGGYAAHVVDGGFGVENSGTIGRLHAVTVSDTGEVVAVGDNGLVVVRSAGGAWDQEAVPTSSNLYAVTEAGAAWYAAGKYGVVLRRSGGVWTKEYEVPETFIYGLWGDGDQVIAVGWTGLILRRGADGWAKEESGIGNVLQAIDGAPGGPVFVVGRKGTVLRRR